MLLCFLNLKEKESIRQIDCFNESAEQSRLIVAGVSTNQYKAKDDSTFKWRAKNLSIQCGAQYAVVTSGKGLADLLKGLSTKDRKINRLVIHAHGDEYGIFFKDNQGIYLDTIRSNPRLSKQYGGGASQLWMSEWGQLIANRSIQFDKQSIVIFLSCKSQAVAYRFSQLTGVVSIGCIATFEPIIRKGRETGVYHSQSGFFYNQPVKNRMNETKFSIEVQELGAILHPDAYLK